jgi:hypothetical protein
VWATKRLLTVRTAAHIADENEWTFGQIFTLVLLAAPLITLIDHLSRRSQAPIDDYSLASGQDTHELTSLAEQPVLSSRQPSANEKRESEYESRISFRGASILAGFSYVHIALFVFLSDNTSPSIAYTFGTLAFSCLVFQPVLQMTWVIYTLWVPKLNLGEHRMLPLLDMIFLAIGLFLVFHELKKVLYEVYREQYMVYLKDKDTPDAITVDGMTALGLFFAYLGFLGWFTWDSHVKTQSRNSCGLGEFVHQRCIAIACSIIISFAANTPPMVFCIIIISRESYEASNLRPGLGIGVGTCIVFACQIVVEMAELGIRRWARRHATLIRASFLAVIILVMAAVFCTLIFTLPGFDRFGPLWLSPLSITFPLWVIIWICYYTVIKQARTSI